MNTRPHCYSFPPDAPFLHHLARYLLVHYGEDSSQFTKLLVLLPNRRSCRALREAFLEITNGKPLLLPRIQPIGDLDGEDFFLDNEMPEPELQPINLVRRQFLLMQLVMRFQRVQGNHSVEQAAELANQLAEFIDDVAREGLSFDALTALAPEELASHWQQTLDFLTIISHEWPRLLEEEGLLDPVEYRNRALTHITQKWKANAPIFPIIAAGSTGSQPATAALLKTIASLPLGRVILPALDKQMPEREWEQLGDTHPQFGLKHLLEHMQIKRADVEYLTPPGKNARAELFSTVFAPPPATAQWANCELPEGGLQGVRLLEADTLLDEARMIAISLRETLQTPEKTAALITPDRTLARMVAAQMQRYGVALDDSAGRPLNTSAPGCFLRLVIEMMASKASPATLLALLRHPLSGAGLNTAECRHLSRELEIDLLRGIRREAGLMPLATATKNPKLKILLQSLAEQSSRLNELMQPNYSATLHELLTEHIAFAQWLAGTDVENGEKRLWAGEAGNALANFIAELRAHADILPAIDPLLYSGLFDTLLAPETYRPQFGLHPRLHILSPMEARLQHFDLVILGSLNDGTWPKTVDPDPWMSRPMRHAFGLPPVERSIGQSALDVQMLCNAPEVILSRARKVEGTPTIPSRWWVRLQTLVGGRLPEIFMQAHAEQYFQEAKTLLETPDTLPPLTAPNPAPPLSARPRSLRVTAIDQWLRDPYIVYAKYILKLSKLDEIDREPDASDFGNVVHKALEIFTENFPHQLPPNALEKLLEAGEQAFADFIDRPAVASLWWPRFQAMAQWLVDTEEERRGHIKAVFSEIKGKWNFSVDGNPFILSTRIDRLESLHDGTRALVDYKTGTIPTKSDIERGLANQLALEALIATYGELSEASSGDIAQMEYWKLAGEELKCKISTVEVDIEDTKTRLEQLIREFDNPQTPYGAQTDPSLLPRYNDYEHLTRRKEWEAI